MSNSEIVYDVANVIIKVDECVIKPVQVNDALQCLVDNGMDEDDAYAVLQNLGYILIDTELFPDC